DISSRMIEKAKARMRNNADIEWITGSLDNIQPQPSFNLIVSSSSLHWITPIKNTFRTIHALLLPNGHFAFSINLKNTFKELYNARKKVAPHKKVVRLPTTKEVLSALLDAGFSVISHKEISIQNKFSSASEFLHTIHKQGLTSGPVSNSGTLLNRRELREVISYYDSRYKNSTGGVFASYDSLCVLATEDKGL
ncbi:MAG: methyltransferase domain-containing protein, partial [Kiritimatiellae bacterium]|nr:methyltransferase domain-containing protein [Kiritimatiellia bacterium]